MGIQRSFGKLGLRAMARLPAGLEAGLVTPDRLFHFLELARQLRHISLRLAEAVHLAKQPVNVVDYSRTSK